MHAQKQRRQRYKEKDVFIQIEYSLQRVLIIRKEVNTRVVYILQLPTLQDLSTSTTSYKLIERSTRLIDQENCVS